MTNSHRSTGLFAALILALSATVTSADPTSYVWSARSSAVSNSTAALAQGHEQRAIRLAADSLANAKGADRVIALHNLCLAHLKQQEPSAAAPHCAAALTEAQAAFGDKTKRIVVNNIEQAQRAQSADAGGK